MGITGLWTVLGQMSAGLNRADYLGTRLIAVDISGFLYSYYYTRPNDQQETYHVRAAFQIITRIISMGLMPVFVFDSGAPHELKQKTLQKRRIADVRSEERHSIVPGTDTDTERLKEYQQLDKDGYDNIVMHFGGNMSQQSQGGDQRQDQRVDQHASCVDQFTLKKPQQYRFTRCEACEGLEPILFESQGQELLVTEGVANALTVQSDTTATSTQLKDCFGADYDYTSTRKLLANRACLYAESLPEQFREYSKWQLDRWLLAGKINECVFSSIRQQRDAARLALAAVQAGHGIRGTAQQDRAAQSQSTTDVYQNGWLDTTADNDDYFASLGPLPLPLPPEDNGAEFAADDASDRSACFHMDLTHQTVQQEYYLGESRPTPAFTSQPENHHTSRTLALFAPAPVVGTTFASFVRRTDSFPEACILARRKRQGQSSGGYQHHAAKPLSKDVIADVQRMASLFRVPCFRCKPGYEAEHICALMNSQGYTAAVLTEDSDTIAYGPVLVLRLFGGLSNIQDVSGFQSIRQRDVHLYLADSDITFLALILGCDFCDGVPGFGYVHAVELLLYLKYLIAPVDDTSYYRPVSVRSLLDRFRQYILFGDVLTYPNSAKARIQAHANFVESKHRPNIEQGWDEVLAYEKQQAFRIYFPEICTPEAFSKDLARLRYLLNRRLWFRREHLVKYLLNNPSDATPGAATNLHPLSKAFATLTRDWNSIVKIYSNRDAVESVCVPVSAGGQSLKGLLQDQSPSAFSVARVSATLCSFIEGTSDYQPQASRELQELLTLQPAVIDAHLTRTNINLKKNIEELTRVQITELFSGTRRYGNLADFRGLGKRAFAALRALFVLQRVYGKQ